MFWRDAMPMTMRLHWRTIRFEPITVEAEDRYDREALVQGTRRGSRSARRQPICADALAVVAASSQAVTQLAAKRLCHTHAQTCCHLVSWHALLPLHGIQPDEALLPCLGAQKALVQNDPSCSSSPCPETQTPNFELRRLLQQANHE